MFKKIKERLAEQKMVALSSHAVGVAGVAVVVGTYITMYPEQVVALLGERYGGILLAVAGAAVTIARVWNATPKVPVETPEAPKAE